MIEKYLFQSDMFVMKNKSILDSSSIIAEALVLKIQENSVEIKNIAVSNQYQRKGYGKELINYICSYYKATSNIKYIYVGTSEYGQGFYERCGFIFSHKSENFFINNYPDPIIENGKKVDHMYYLIKKL